MTEADAKRSLEVARRKAHRFAVLRNLWRTKVRHRLKRYRYDKAHKLTRNGNIIEGGTLQQRIGFLFKVAPKVFRVYYSEGGSYYGGPWACTNVPVGDWRSDCSSWGRSTVESVKLEIPFAAQVLAAASAFYTGWVVANCQEVDRHYAETHIGTAVIYGTGTGFHMGLSMADGERTIQHGTAPLTYGTFGEFGAGTQVRYFKFLT